MVKYFVNNNSAPKIWAIYLHENAEEDCGNTFLSLDEAASAW